MMLNLSNGVPDPGRVCAKTVMDETDPDIRFDAAGISNWWHDYQAALALQPPEDERRDLCKRMVNAVKESGRGRAFDCVLGLSGGVDSSYMAYLAGRWGLRPLVVHFDNGWNDELAVGNIEKIVKKLDLTLSTFVMDWPEFRDLQRAYFKAGVLDLEVPTDHLITGALYRIAVQHGIKYILSGNNFATEWLLPRQWHYAKGDLANLEGVHRAFGERPLRHLPRFGVWHRVFYERVRQIQSIQVLDLIPYKKLQAKRTLVGEFRWTDYGGKHFESVFTRFYQGYVLPRRFGIDKRKAHLSNLILNGEITREDALAELSKPTYDESQQQADKRYVAKKLGWSDAQFEEILELPRRRHEEFGTDVRQRRAASTFGLYIQGARSLSRRIRRATPSRR